MLEAQVTRASGCAVSASRAVMLIETSRSVSVDPDACGNNDGFIAVGEVRHNEATWLPDIVN